MIRDICKDELFLARKAAPASPEDLPIAQDLLETLIIDHCVGCQREGADVKNCQIRRHQYKCMRITEPRQYKRCEYEIGGGDGLSD